ncbi:MAG: YdcF family protein [Eubacterium sp.]|nr:YdcF family protein [Eubacterium sp.]
MSKLKKTIYGILSAAGLIIFFWSFLPVTAGVLHMGMITMAVMGLFMAIYCLLSLKYPKEEIPFKEDQDAAYKVMMELKRQNIANGEDTKIRGTVLFGMKNVDLEAYDKKIEEYDVPGLVFSRETREKMDKVIIAILVVFAVLFGFLSFKAATGYDKYDGKYDGQTIVVLGCETSGDRPTIQLESRLDTAAEMLKSNADAKVVVTGSQSVREIKARCQIMYDYLTIEKGIEADRIYKVDSPNNLDDTFAGVKTIAEKNNLEDDIIVITSAAEQAGAQKAAEKADLDSCGANAKTEPWMWFAVWCNGVL